jgi:hypothetical protein
LKGISTCWKLTRFTQLVCFLFEFWEVFNLLAMNNYVCMYAYIYFYMYTDTCSIFIYNETLKICHKIDITYSTFLVQNAFKAHISPHQFQTIKYIIEIKPKNNTRRKSTCHNISHKINCLFMLKNVQES